MKKSVEQLVWERAQRRYEYCLLPQSIDVLQINHFAAVRLREELMGEGLFPPG